MISQKQNNMHWPGEVAWRGWSLWLRVLGVAVAFVGGFAFSFPNPLPLALVIVEPIVLAIVSAGLLRSWWAMLIVPVAFSMGFFLGNIFQMGGFDLQSWVASGFEGVDILVILGVVPIAIGAAIGTPIGKKIEQRLQH